VLKARNPDEGTYACSNWIVESKKTFSISYGIGAKGAQLLTPVPRELRDLSQQFDY
jgi:hypothetical protein